ncbi:MAG: hypothetical protein RBS36_04260 [Thiomicrospira sp.]|jgi:GNAT superfamily N-acetyltransferase|nr:hypothetical protein [Thiomicrospira sp.]
MRKIKVERSCEDYKSYRAERVKSLFNAETGANFTIEAEMDLDFNWNLGVIVGPSGTGKTTIGSAFFDDAKIYEPDGWGNDRPIIDCIDPDGDFNGITAALSAVGLGSVPAWLRPYSVLSNGEKFRADLAKIIAEKPARVIIDEFTSVIDRQVAKFGSLAFQKAWKRTGGQCVLLSCHYDVLEWLEPCWVFDTQTGKFERGGLRRPKFELEIRKVDSKMWRIFEPHYYLKLPKMIAAEYYCGFVDGEPVCHVGVSPKLEISGVRASRLVVMPEWQGAGVGIKFLEGVLDIYVNGESKYGKRVKAAYFHTSHPGLCHVLRMNKKWRQTSCALYGGNKSKSSVSIRKSAEKKRPGEKSVGGGSGYGGHMRAVQGFKYYGSAIL